MTTPPAAPVPANPHPPTGAAAGTPTAPPPAAAGNPPPAVLPPFDLLDFLWKAHSYMNEYIRFADTKATVVIALSTALLGGLLTAEAHHWCSPRLFNITEPEWKASWQGIGAFLSITFLVLAFVCAILAMTPRLWSVQITGLWATLKHMFWVPKPTADHTAGFIYWGEILKHGNADNFWAVMSGKTKAKVEEHLGKRLYVLSGIAEEKYFYANRSIFFLLLGAIIASLFILSSR